LEYTEQLDAGGLRIHHHRTDRLLSRPGLAGFCSMSLSFGYSIVFDHSTPQGDERDLAGAVHAAAARPLARNG